jgi:hypothetical protein
MKSSHSNNVLACKGVLLEVVVNKDVFSDRLVGVKTFLRLLGIKRKKIHHALMRQQSLQIYGASQFDLFQKEKRLHGLSNDSKTLVQLWWTNET